MAVLTHGAQAYTGLEPFGGQAALNVVPALYQNQQYLGNGYSNLMAQSQCNIDVSNVSSFLSAIKTAGNKIWLSAMINLTGYTGIQMADGITLASDINGGISQLDMSLRYSTILYSGANTRLLGLKIVGPDPTVATGDSLPFTTGIEFDKSGCVVESCEITAWPYAGLLDYANTKFIFNYIHHCQRQGVGYGVSCGMGNSALIMGNYIDYCRHQIQGERAEETGQAIIPPSYEACYNIFGPHGINAICDMHGGNDTIAKGWGTLPQASPPYSPTIWAGGTVLIHHNTDLNLDQCLHSPRGIPKNLIHVWRNWVLQTGNMANICPQVLDQIVQAGGIDPVTGLRITGQYVRMVVEDNWQGTTPPPVDSNIPSAAPANIVLSNIAVSPVSAPAGSSFVVSVTATNIGGSSGSATINLAGTWSGSQVITLAAGASTVVKFNINTVTTILPGTYIETIGNLSVNFVVTAVTPTPLPANIVLSDMKVSPAQIYVGQTANVLVTATNNGGSTGTGTISLGGWWPQDQSITLAPAASQVLTFPVAPSSNVPVGTYPVTIGSLTTNVVVIAQPSATPANIVLSDLVISPNPALMQTKITVTVTATNNGGTAGSKLINLASWWPSVQTVNLAPGASAKVVFTFTPSPAATPGKYQIGVNELSGVLTIVSATPSAGLVFSNISISPASVKQLQPTYITLLVKNNGNSSITHTVYMTGWWDGSKTITVPAGQTQTVKFTVISSTRTPPGSYVETIEGLKVTVVISGYTGVNASGISSPGINNFITAVKAFIEGASFR